MPPALNPDSDWCGLRRHRLLSSVDTLCAFMYDVLYTLHAIPSLLSAMNNQNQQPQPNPSDQSLQARLALLAAQQQNPSDRPPVSQDHIAAMAAAVGSMQGQNRDAIMKQASNFSHRPRPQLTSRSYKRSRAHMPIAQSLRRNRRSTSSLRPDLAPHRLQTNRVYLHPHRLPRLHPPTLSIKTAFSILVCLGLAQATV